jgi:hypothetical protein
MAQKVKIFVFGFYFEIVTVFCGARHRKKIERDRDRWRE